MSVSIRKMGGEDPPAVAEAFKSWNKTVKQYEDYYSENVGGNRVTLIAWQDGKVVGYGNLLRKAYHEGFAGQGIPEINDLNVVEEMQARGIGRALIAELEAVAMAAGYSTVGIGVVLHPDYARAQRLYPRLGYVSDGQPPKPTPWGDEIHFTKRLDP